MSKSMPWPAGCVKSAFGDITLDGHPNVGFLPFGKFGSVYVGTRDDLYKMANEVAIFCRLVVVLIAALFLPIFLNRWDMLDGYTISIVAAFSIFLWAVAFGIWAARRPAQLRMIKVVPDAGR